MSEKNLSTFCRSLNAFCVQTVHYVIKCDTKCVVIVFDLYLVQSVCSGQAVFISGLFDIPQG